MQTFERRTGVEEPIPFTEALKFLGLDSKGKKGAMSLYHLVFARRIPFLRLGRKLYFLRSELLEQMKEAAKK